MIIVEKNEGQKIDYSVNRYKITFEGDCSDLTLKLDKLQQDWPVHKDICIDEDGDLTLGVAAGRYYCAEVDIPAREYEEPEEEGGEGEAPQPIPLDMDNVTLTLWSVENLIPTGEED